MSDLRWRVLPANSESLFFKAIDPDMQQQSMGKNIERVVIEVCYCSSFDECWISTSAMHNQAVTECDWPASSLFH